METLEDVIHEVNLLKEQVKNNRILFEFVNHDKLRKIQEDVFGVTSDIIDIDLKSLFEMLEAGGQKHESLSKRVDSLEFKDPIHE